MATSTCPEPYLIVTCPSCRERHRVRTAAGEVLRCASCHRPLPWLVEADDDSYAAAVSGPLPVLVDLWAPWCGPCRLDAPAVEWAAGAFAGRLKVVTVNVDDAPEVARLLDARVVPTLLVIDHGREIAHQFGVLSEEELADWLAGVLPKAA